MFWFSDKRILDKLKKLSKQVELLYERLQVIDFKVTVPKSVVVFCVSQERVSIMGTSVKVFTYKVELAAVPEGNDAIAQELQMKGVFVDVDNTVVEQVIRTGPEATTQIFKAKEGSQVTLELYYEDDDSNKSLLPQKVEWIVRDLIAPKVPEGAITSVVQKDQEMVEIPDLEPEPEPDPETE